MSNSDDFFDYDAVEFAPHHLKPQIGAYDGLNEKDLDYLSETLLDELIKSQISSRKADETNRKGTDYSAI